VPEGLVLLTSVAFAAAVVRLGRRGVLVQELPAVESLARVDVLCIDKTGTLTEGRMVVEAVEAVEAVEDAPAGTEGPGGAEGPGADDPTEALRAMAAADPHPNVTLQALASRLGPPSDGWRQVAAVPFSSARKWSAASFAGRGTWVLGAPELLLDRDPDDPVGRQVEAHARQGRRVVLLERSPAALAGEALPDQRRPAALVVLADQVRADATATLAYFHAQGVVVKVLSGDHPATAAAVAARVGVPGAAAAVDARTLPEAGPPLEQAVEEHAVFGRVTPQQKRSMVRALQSRGHVVAMTGDGVNDVLALKAADLGIAMGSGSAATRAVAKLVLLHGRFAALPPVVAEGRRVLANIERTANLFVTKTVYALLLAIAVGIVRFPFPFLPRHLTLIGALTIGVPGFLLALGPNPRRARPGIVGRVVRFAAPAGVMAATATLATYVAVRGELGAGLAEARTTAVIVLGWIGLLILLEMARPLTVAHRGMVAAMGAAFAGTFAIPAARRFFALQPPPPIVWLAAVGVGAIFVSLLRTVIPEPGGPPRPDRDPDRPPAA
jgi:cation-transporting ATPase E/undecaprenyl-diphosphatase